MKSRKLLSGLLLACLSSFLHAKGAPQNLDVFDFSKGLDSYHASATLPDGFVKDSCNGLFDDKGPFTKRNGYTVAWTTKTYQYTGLWTYVDQTNTFWQIVRSSDQITANKLDGTASVKISTVSSNDLVGEVNAFGNAYFADPTQGVFYWNGTSTTYVNGSPKGSIIAQFHQRIWVTGAAVPNGNQLYGSKYYDGTVWATANTATDPVQYSVGLNDNFDNETALYVYLDTLYLFKKFSIFALTGLDQTNFQISQLTQECGCIDQGSIQTFNGGLKFVSLRGVENFNGYTCERISGSVKNKVDNAITTGGFNTSSWIQNSVADWNAGSFNLAVDFSTTIAAPSLVLSTGTRTENSSTQWNSGTLNNLVVSGGVIRFNNVDGNVSNSGFESGSSTPFWDGTFSAQASITSSNLDGACGFVTPYAGSYMLAYNGTDATYTVNAKVMDCAVGSVLAETDTTCGPALGCSTWVSKTINLSGLSYKCGVILLQDTNGLTITRSKPFYISGSNMTFQCRGGNSKYSYFDAFLGGDNTALHDGSVSSGVSSGTFTSQSIDTGIYNPTIYPIASWSNTTYPSGGGTSTPIRLVTQTSRNGSTGWTEITNSTAVNVQANRYIRYVSTLSLDALGYFENADDSLSSVGYTWTASSGVFTSQCHGTTGINSFGNFTIDQTLSAGGTLSYAVCSSASSNCSSPTCKTTSANSQITVSTNAFVDYIATFTVVAATEAPRLNSSVVQWYTGTRATPMASTVWDNRYWLSLTTSTNDSNNDAILVLNSQNRWAVFDTHAGGLTQFKNNLYHADATATGNIYLDNQGYADNGAAINAYIVTKDYSMGDISRDHYLSAIHPSMENGGSCNVTFQYTPDKSTSTYSLGTPSQSEFATLTSLRLPVPIDSTHQNFGRTFNFTVGTNDATCPWTFYGLRGIYKQRPLEGASQ